MLCVVRKNMLAFYRKNWYNWERNEEICPAQT